MAVFSNHESTIVPKLLRLRLAKCPECISKSGYILYIGWLTFCLTVSRRSVIIILVWVEEMPE